MKKISNYNMFRMAQSFKDYVENNGGVPYKYTYDGVDYYTKDMTWIFTVGLYHLKSNIDVRDNIRWCSNANGDNIVENIYLDDYKDQALRVHNYIIDKGQVPNNVKTTKSKKTVNIDLYTYCMAKILVYYHDHKELPAYCSYNYKDLAKKTKPSQKSRSEKILDEFESYFGVCKYIDDALAKIQGRGYEFYFSDGYNMSETIKRVYQRKGANCYDIAEVLYHLALGMNTKYGRNYQVQYLDVWCPVSGYDHIRIRLRNGSNGDWFYRDGACVLDGGGVTENWCGTSNNIIEVNPSWIMDG